jgi:hypothetical protein
MLTMPPKPSDVQPERLQREDQDARADRQHMGVACHACVNRHREQDQRQKPDGHGCEQRSF